MTERKKIYGKEKLTSHFLQTTKNPDSRGVVQTTNLNLTESDKM